MAPNFTNFPATVSKVRSFNRASLSSPRFKRLLFQVVSCVGHVPFRSRFVNNPLHAIV